MMIWIALGFAIGSIFGRVLCMGQWSLLVFLAIAPIISVIVDPHSNKWFKEKFFKNESKS